MLPSRNTRPSLSNLRKIKDELFPIQQSQLYRLSKLPGVKKVFKFARGSLLPHVSPGLTLAMVHLRTFGYWPNLRQPKTFIEKIQWKKLHDRRELLVRTADKFAVRDYVRAKGLEGILIPLLWYGTDPKAIPFEQLSERFVVPDCPSDAFATAASPSWVTGRAVAGRGIVPIPGVAVAGGGTYEGQKPGRSGVG
jgi:hypothetical protein